MSRNGVTYPRQQLTTVAYAAAIPVDGTNVQFNSEGELTFSRKNTSLHAKFFGRPPNSYAEH